jgi:transcriptional regulator with XRE-family HTH domain
MGFYFAYESTPENLRHKYEKFRKKAGLSQKELADKRGLHRTHVSLIEREKRNVSNQTIEKIAKALDLDPHLLLKR